MQKVTALLALALVVISGCASMYGGQNLSDESLRSDIAGVLGDDPQNITIESRRSEGANTYVIVKTKKGTRLACNLIGGGVMMMGMRNPPSCNPITESSPVVVPDTPPAPKQSTPAVAPSPSKKKSAPKTSSQ